MKNKLLSYYVHKGTQYIEYILVYWSNSPCIEV